MLPFSAQPLAAGYWTLDLALLLDGNCPAHSCSSQISQFTVSLVYADGSSSLPLALSAYGDLKPLQGPLVREGREWTDLSGDILHLGYVSNTPLFQTVRIELRDFQVPSNKALAGLKFFLPAGSTSTLLIESARLSKKPGSSLALASTQAQATACSQLGHWSWPPEFDAKEFGASIGNHEGVRLKYYTDLNDFSKVVQVSRSGFVDTTTYEHRSNTSSIYVTTRGSIQDSYTVDKNDSRYLATLTRMRDLIGYIGAPESYFRPNGGPDSLNVQTIYLVKYLDQIIESLGKAPSNCVLYKDVAAPLSENACHLTGGALFTLGAWNENIKAVWVRSGYRLTLIDDDNFSKA
ncbi:hypothetical protein DAPPUDRAFT_124562, partial [Daphnia pulex]